MNKKLATILFVFLLVAGTTSIYAQQSVLEVKKERTNPDGGFSFLAKRLEEKFKLFISSPFPSRKEKVYEDLNSVRLSELKYVVEKPDMANFEKATIRYSTTVGMWVEYIAEKKLDAEKASTRETLLNHKPIIENLMTHFDTTTAEWRFLKHDLDYLQIYSDQIK